VLPLLTLADQLRTDDPACEVTVLGTADGIETRLVPARGYPLELVPKVPLPRRISPEAARLPGRLGSAVRAASRVVVGSDVVVGFGGYVAAPAFLAARRARVPIVVHEANARPGFANRLGARLTRYVAVATPGTRLPYARHVGMPLRPEIARLDRGAVRESARLELGLDPDLVTLLVTGGSQGAKRLNDTIVASAGTLGAHGVQVLHLTGVGKEVEPARAAGAPPYVVLPFLDDMTSALAAADLVVCRAGAMTVAEMTAVGLPAIYVPLPIGNGEQRRNAVPVVAVGGGLLVGDSDFSPSWVEAILLPLVADAGRRAAMGAAASRLGVRDGAERLAELVRTAAGW
jgi:UDP-N-acetylglucosamine--N-acetylmuramyl-(pentapeptide) pyrophosphoryl-undecaprenol N-acetylglucosamine transferase